MTAAVLTRRALNRALLARQYLLASADVPAQIAIEHLVGLQSQAPNPPYIGLWTRVAGFEFDELAQLIRDRKVARLALMRGTIHLVTAADAHRIRPLVQPVLDRGFRSSSYARAVRGLDVAGVAAAGQAAVERTPLSFTELGEVLRQAWPDRDATALAQVVRAYVALIQVPPRGIWGEVGQARHTSILAWLGQPPDSSLSTVDDLVMRYLGAFGPASTADIQTWSGLTRLGEVVERLRPRLATFRDEDRCRASRPSRCPRPGPDLTRPCGSCPSGTTFCCHMPTGIASSPTKSSQDRHQEWRRPRVCSHRWFSRRHLEARPQPRLDHPNNHSVHQIAEPRPDGGARRRRATCRRGGQWCAGTARRARSTSSLNLQH